MLLRSCPNVNESTDGNGEEFVHKQLDCQRFANTNFSVVTVLGMYISPRHSCSVSLNDRSYSSAV